MLGDTFIAYTSEMAPKPSNLTPAERQFKRIELQRKRRARLYAMGLNALGQPRTKFTALGLPKRFKKAEILPALVIVSPNKYDHFISEPTNQGYCYAEYVMRGRKRTEPMRKAFTDKLKAERKERIKRLGKIVIPKMGPKQWTQFGTKFSGVR